MRTSPRSHAGVNKVDAADHESYQLNGEAERKRAQLHREAKDTRNEQYLLYWNAEAVVFARTSKKLRTNYIESARTGSDGSYSKRSSVHAT